MAVAVSEATAARETQVCKQCSRRKLNEVKQPTVEKRVNTQAIRRKNTYTNPYSRSYHGWVIEVQQTTYKNRYKLYVSVADVETTVTTIAITYMNARRKRKLIVS